MGLKLGTWAFQDPHNTILWSWMRQMMNLNVDMREELRIQPFQMMSLYLGGNSRMMMIGRR